MDWQVSSKFSAVGLTDIGLRRQNNEDNFLIDHDLDLFLVADGVGGHMAGEVAAGMAIAAIRKSLLDSTGDQTHADWSDDTTPDVLEALSQTQYFTSDRDYDIDEQHVVSALNHASRVLFEESQRQQAAKGRSMGTTIVGLHFLPPHDGGAMIFHVGDSRLYLFRDRQLHQLTVDHSAYERWVANGRSGPMPSRSIILQALGQTPKVKPGLRFERFVKGDLVLMCTDGLSDYLDNQTIATHMAAIDGGDLARGCQHMIDDALARRGADNITVILGRYD